MKQRQSSKAKRNLSKAWISWGANDGTKLHVKQMDFRVALGIRTLYECGWFQLSPKEHGHIPRLEARDHLLQDRFLLRLGNDHSHVCKEV